MSFHDVLFPTDVSYGSQGGPSFNTLSVRLASGATERLQRWPEPIWLYDVAYGIKSPEQMDSVYEFFLLRRGAVFPFRYEDFRDFTSALDHRSLAVSPSDQPIGVGDGSETQFQLVKVYTDASFTFTRTITKPKSGTVTVAIDNATKTLGADFTVDYSTGVITFASAPSNGANVTAGYQFDVPVRFSDEVDSGGLLAVREAFDVDSIPSIPLIEEKDENPSPGVLYYGGATDHGTASGLLAISNTARLHRFAATSALEVRLPALTYIADGGPHFVLYQAGSATVTVKDALGTTTIATLTTSARTARIFSGSASGAKYWVAA